MAFQNDAFQSGAFDTSHCPVTGEMVEDAVDRILTQYRESPNLLGLTRTLLGRAEEAAMVVCGIPEFFDLDSAVGDQLTLLGKRLGWPRCHCVCDIQPAFGFDCGGFNYIPIAGFCDDSSTWLDCNVVGVGEICLADDETYRGYLKARRYQAMGLYDVASLQAAAGHVWGEAASVVETGVGYVVLAPGRLLTGEEKAQIALAVRVMPIAPGIRATLHLEVGQIFGFGAGWGGFCDEPEVLTTESGAPITTEDGDPIIVDVDSDWLCPVDAHPYDCAA